MKCFIHSTKKIEIGLHMSEIKITRCSEDRKKTISGKENRAAHGIMATYGIMPHGTTLN
jgi:hypothetical protein